MYQEHSFTTVLALDMVNFTRFSSQSSPEAMISMMSEIFDMFDAVAERHNVHRAKIIGECAVFLFFSGLSTWRWGDLEESCLTLQIGNMGSHSLSLSVCVCMLVDFFVGG